MQKTGRDPSAFGNVLNAFFVRYFVKFVKIASDCNIIYDI